MLRLGAAVAATFAVVWAPWLAAPGGALGVLRRIFPTQRGLYEDYVANWWCASSRLVKWARLLPQPSLVKLCGATTLAALAPAGVLAAARPTPRALLLCLANSAMAFFLFSYQVGRPAAGAGEGPRVASQQPWQQGVAECSMNCTASRGMPHSTGCHLHITHTTYTSRPASHIVLLQNAGSTLVSLPAPCPSQVHEKSILLPLLPLAMLLGGEQPGLLCWANAVAVFSMLPLLKKDGLALATAGATAACHAAIQLAAGMVGSKQGSSNGSGKRSAAAGSLGALPPAWLAAGWRLSLAGCAAILAASAVAPPPPKLPFLYDALTVTWALLHFAALFAYTNWLQWLEFRSAAPGRRAAKRKQA